MNESRVEIISTHLEVSCPELVFFALRESTWWSQSPVDETHHYQRFGFSTPNAAGRVIFCPELIDHHTAGLSGDRLFMYLEYWEYRLRSFQRNLSKSLSVTDTETLVLLETQHSIPLINRRIVEQLCAMIEEGSHG